MSQPGTVRELDSPFIRKIKATIHGCLIGAVIAIGAACASFAAHENGLGWFILGLLWFAGGAFGFINADNADG